MIVSSYEVQASSQYSYMKAESHTSQTGLVKESDLAALLGGQAGQDEATLVDLSKETSKQLAEQAAQSKQNMIEQFKNQKAASLKSSIPTAFNPLDLKLTLLEMMIQALTGKRSSAKLWQPQNNSSSSSFNLSQIFGNSGRSSSGTEVMRQVTQTEHFYYESEYVSYQAKGLIQTADGKSISVDINMQLSREFVSYSSSTEVWAQPKDPLVINYAGTAASLTGQKYDFDLTMDGNMEQMSFVGQGSGFLAVDWNNDGTINDGSELFGPQSGDGFEELRKYDADGNGWIDEADDIFSKLVVWSKDENGNDQIFTLKELGIGAIYLGNIDTQFSMNDDQNNTNGVMRTTSFFLKESGGAGTVSQIDLMI